MIKTKRKHPEKKLENWLKKNLQLFENGLRLVKTQYRNYYFCGDIKCFNQIDILALDKNGLPVIIEVKIYVNQFTLNKQLLGYMKRFPQKCRGIIAALHIPQWLLATKLPSNITLWCVKENYGARYSRKKSG